MPASLVRRAARSMRRARFCRRNAACARRAAVHAAGWASLDDARPAQGWSSQRFPPARAGTDRHRHAADVRHRPARPAGLHAAWQYTVGLHLADRRGHHHPYQGPRRVAGDRYLLRPAFLYHARSVEPRVRQRPRCTCTPTKSSAWVMRPDPCIKPWRGETFELLPGVTLVRGGGHFPGGSMLHWAAGAEGRGGRFLLGRHRHGQPRPQVLHLHSPPSKPHPPVGEGRAGDRARRWRRSSSIGSTAISSSGRCRRGQSRRCRISIERYVAAIGGAYDRA